MRYECKDEMGLPPRGSVAFQGLSGDPREEEVKLGVLQAYQGTPELPYDPEDRVLGDPLQRMETVGGVVVDPAFLRTQGMYVADRLLSPDELDDLNQGREDFD